MAWRTSFLEPQLGNPLTVLTSANKMSSQTTEWRQQISPTWITTCLFAAMQKRNLTCSFSVLLGIFWKANLRFLSNLFFSVMFCDLANVGSITSAAAVRDTSPGRHKDWTPESGWNECHCQRTQWIFLFVKQWKLNCYHFCYTGYHSYSMTC